MSQEVAIIFPHQLFTAHPALTKKRVVWLVEETLFFNQYAFHKQKLILHRASMKAYASRLLAEGFTVEYADAVKPVCDIRHLITVLAKKGVQQIHVANPTDEWLLKRLQKTCSKNNISLHLYGNPNFINTSEEINQYFSGKKRYFQTDF